MISIGFHVEGTEKVRNRLKALAKEMPEAVMVGLYRQAERVMDAAVQRAPKDTGELRNSAFIGRPTVAAGEILIQLGFSAPHAAQVHEDTGRAYREGEAKFLEKAFVEQAKGSLYKIAGYAEKAARSGKRWVQGKYPTGGE